MAESMEQSRELFECAICLTNMVARHPKALVCLHTFCQECLENLVKSNAEIYNIICPTCRKETLVSDGKIENLPENFQLKNMFEVFHTLPNTKLCSLCKETSKIVEAIYECSKCNLKMCNACKAAHERRFTKKPHPVVGVDKSVKVTVDGFSSIQKGCKLHNNTNIEYWCKNCQELLCAVCTIHGKHSEHDIEDFEDYVNEKVQSLIRKSANKQQFLESCGYRDCVLDDIVNKASTLKEKIADLGEKMKIVIDAQVGALIDTCETEYIQPAIQEKVVIKDRLEAVSGLEKNLEKCAKADSPHAIYSLLADMEKQVLNMEMTPDPPKTAYPVLCGGTPIDEIKLGNVIPVQLSNDEALQRRPFKLDGGTSVKQIANPNSQDDLNDDRSSKTVDTPKNENSASQLSLKFVSDPAREPLAENAKLEPPEVVLEMDVWKVQGLNDKGALLATDTRPFELRRVNEAGGYHGDGIYGDSRFEGMLLHDDHVLALEHHGRITRRPLSHLSLITHTYDVSASTLYGGTLFFPDLGKMALIDLNTEKGEVFTTTFKHSFFSSLLATEKEVKVGGLRFPAHISCTCVWYNLWFAVTERDAHHVLVFDVTWTLKFTVGRRGRRDGELEYPTCALFLPTGNLLVADTNNHRVSEFTRQGEFVCHWLTKNDGVCFPRSLSFVAPHLWVAGKNVVARYKIRDNEKDQN